MPVNIQIQIYVEIMGKGLGKGLVKPTSHIVGWFQDFQKGVVTGTLGL